MLHQELQRGGCIAIAGMGGVGKTELATQYARRYQQDYGEIAWFNARITILAAQVLQFFVKFGYEIPQERGGKLLSIKEQVAWCWSQYPEAKLPILIIFDDVTDLGDLSEVVPTDDRFLVLITTRIEHLDPSYIQKIPLDVLSPQKEPGKAVELLKGLLGKTDKRVDKQPDSAAAVCECLGYLPLGIQLVGGYLVRDPDISLDIMFGRLGDAPLGAAKGDRKLAEESLQNRETLNSTQLGVKAAFDLTWEALDPLAQQLGIFLSLFAPQLILWDLVNWVATESPFVEETETTAPQTENFPVSEEESKSSALIRWSSDELNAAKKQLYGSNLLQQVEEREGYYKIHALVRWFLQAKLAETDEIKSVLETTFATAMIVVAKSLSDSPTSKDIESVRDVIPHLEDLGKRLIAEIQQATQEQIISPASVSNDQIIWVFEGVGRFYAGQGLYQLAEPWGEECVKVYQALFAGDHPDVASSLNNLAGLYDSQGRYNEAEPLLIEALKIAEVSLGVSHRNTITIRKNLKYLRDNRRFKLVDVVSFVKRFFSNGRLG